jgi:CheY-like chemotaxis protein
MVRHILIADDDEDDRMLFSDALRQISGEIELSMAEDGVELLTMLKAADPLPDVLFLDLNMPAKNGFESLQEIRQDPRLRQLPVIIFTTTANHHTVDQLFGLGARYFIQKPTDFNVLIRLIRTILDADIAGSPDSKKEFVKYMQQ